MIVHSESSLFLEKIRKSTNMSLKAFLHAPLHFNSANHSLNHIMICGLNRWSGDNTCRKNLELRLIFELGTVKPNGLSIN